VNERGIYRRVLLSVALGVLLLGGLVYVRKIEPGDVEVVPVSLVLPRLDARFDGYRIAQISDIPPTAG
jgi:predicted MPP superfamily phosphohydrolase